MSESVECVVIGAGVVGLAVARALTLGGRTVLVVEKERYIGAHTSSRNSEIIHAGLYYPANSLKARFCVAGRKRLYEYCAAHGVATKRIGKLVVATDDDEVPQLAKVMARAAANGVDDLELLDAKTARAMEPELSCVGAFHSPSTGLIDSHALMLSLQGEAEAHGATVALRAEVGAGHVLDGGGFTLEIIGDGAMTLDCEILVNAAGLYAPGVARRVAGVPPESIPRDYYCRGVYFTLPGKAPFRRPVYPVPEHAGLGVHYTPDLAGQGRFGPDTEWIDGIDYTVDPQRGARFYAAIRKYWPALPDDALQPGYAGIRPKISAPDEPAADFRIDGAERHGVPGLINLFGIESPGLTSSLAIADLVAALVNETETVPAPLARVRPAR
ncbi:MAG: NAD(P)/FAD-dependent oxidoreductase [Alphaproteobacteria bacterium]|nr:NAD(P)/FAD-dependent oxidoreductase [Alphaproteobacteria bacterium]